MMASMFALKLLKNIARTALFFVQALGVWPYRYDEKSKRCYTTKVLCCYTAVVLPFVFVAYVVALKSMKIDEDFRVHIPSSTGRFTTAFLALNVSLVYVINSVYQIMNYNKINVWLKDARVLMDKIESYKRRHGQLSFLRPLLQYILNVLLMNCLMIYATIGILSNLISDSTVGKYWIIFFYILPNVSIKVVPDIFYGFMLMTTYYYRTLNQHLRNIMQELRYRKKLTLSETTECNQKYSFMKQSCRQSDAIDQLAILHRELTTCTVVMNRIFSVNLMSLVTCEVFVFISKVFIVYLIFEFEIRRLSTSLYNFKILWYNVVVLVVSFWTPCVLSHSCQMTMEESGRTTDILLSVLLNESIDVRLRRSVEAFSMQLVNNKLKLTICGLYQMDHTVLYSIVATAVSYSLILIQFELKEHEYSK